MPRTPRLIDRVGPAPVLHSWGYANARLRTHTPQAPAPTAPFWYRDPGLWLPLSCAVAINGTPISLGNIVGTSLTFSYNNPAGDLLFVGALSTTAGSITGITYNVAGMAPVATNISDGGSGSVGWLYALNSPATGTHNVVVSANASVFLAGVVWGYAGTATSGDPEASTTGAHNSTGSSDPLVLSLATLTDLAWLVAYGFSGVPTVTLTGSGTSRANSDFGTSLAADRGPITPAGTSTISMYPSGSGANVGGIICSVKPAGGGGGGITYPELERAIRGLNRGLTTGLN